MTNVNCSICKRDLLEQPDLDFLRLVQKQNSDRIPSFKQNVGDRPSSMEGVSTRNLSIYSHACVTSCGHLFHTYCVTQWFTMYFDRESHSPTCPCGNKSSPVDLRPVDLYPTLQAGSPGADAIAKAKSTLAAENRDLRDKLLNEELKTINLQTKLNRSSLTAIDVGIKLRKTEGEVQELKGQLKMEERKRNVDMGMLKSRLDTTKELLGAEIRAKQVVDKLLDESRAQYWETARALSTKEVKVAELECALRFERTKNGELEREAKEKKAKNNDYKRRFEKERMQTKQLRCQLARGKVRFAKVEKELEETETELFNIKFGIK